MASNGAVKLRFPPLPSIREIIKLYNLKALRQLSQNFLLDSHLNNKIVNCCGSLKGAEVCEVGPGPGNLTRSIIYKGAHKVHVVEKDQRFLPSLQLLSDAAPEKLNIRHGDVLHFDMSNLFSEDRRKVWNDIPPNIHLIGNLPFNISTPLIIKWLRAISERNNAWSYGRVKMTLTFQKEVAERMESPIMTKHRCRLSVMCQNWCEVKLKLIIPGKAFLPKPRVDVGVVHLVPRIEPIIPLPFELVEKVVTALFMFRQRHISRGLKLLFPLNIENEMAEKMLTEAELPGNLRSYQLSNLEIGRLCYAFKNISDTKADLLRYKRSSKSADWESREADSEEKAEQFQKRIILDEFY